MNYCLYIEHSAENLQFYLWLHGYTKRFSEAPQFERELSPEWTTKDQDWAMRRARVETYGAIKREGPAPFEQRETFKGPRVRDDAKSIISNTTSVVQGDNPFDTPPSTPRVPTPSTDAAPPFGRIRGERRPSTIGSASILMSKDESLYSSYSASTIASKSFSDAALCEPCRRIYPSIAYLLR